MFETSVSGDLHVRRPFGYARITWRVEHFWVLTCRKKWEVDSQEFEVHKTRWKMILKPMSKDVTSKHMMSLYLERTTSDHGPDSVRANWKVRMRNCKDDSGCPLFGEREDLFQRGVRLEEVIEIMDCLTRDFEPFESDDLIFECDLIVSQPDVTPEECSEECGDEGLRSLSNDLRVQFQAGQSCDVVVRVGQEDVPAVGALLHARNPTLASILDRDDRPEIVDLLAGRCQTEVVSADAVRKVLGYLHYGRLEEVLCRPSVGTAECARLLDADELTVHFIPDEIGLTTGMDIWENVVTWYITEFAAKGAEPLVSPTSFADARLEGMSWRLFLYPKGRNRGGEHVSLYAQMFEKESSGKELSTCLEIAIADAEQNFYRFRRLQRSPGGSTGDLGVEDFLDRSGLTEAPFLQDGTLRIVCRIRRSAGLPIQSDVQHSVTSVAVPPRGLRHLERLSEDVGSLLWSVSKSADFTIRCGGDRLFRVHRSVMSARARAFTALTGSGDELNLPLMMPEVVEALLVYVYTGKLLGLADELVSQLYRLANYFEVESLKQVLCMDYRVELSILFEDAVTKSLS